MLEEEKNYPLWTARIVTYILYTISNFSYCGPPTYSQMCISDESYNKLQNNIAVHFLKLKKIKSTNQSKFNTKYKFINNT